MSAADGIEGCPRANKECLRGCMFAQRAGIRQERSGAGEQEGLLGVRVRPKEPLAARNFSCGRTKCASEDACSPREREFSRKEAERANKRCCGGFVFARRNCWQPETFLAGEQRVPQRMHVRPESGNPAGKKRGGRTRGSAGGSCSPEGTAGSPELFLRANKGSFRECMFAQGAARSLLGTCG